MTASGEPCPRKLRGGKKRALLRDLADGSLSYPQLAIKYDVHYNTIKGWADDTQKRSR